jgi:HEAT repeat protein
MLRDGLKLLAQKEPKAICRGAAMLARTGRREAVDALLPLLRSRSESVADCVRGALNRMDVVPVLLERWHSADAAKRTDAMNYAAALAHPGLMALYREAARDTLSGLREMAAVGLNKQKRSAEVLQLLGVLASDTERDVRWWAIESLGLLGGPDAVGILERRRASETDAGLRTFIDKALERARPH